MNYKEIFKQAEKDAEKLTFAEIGTNVMIYPCGFAWIYLNNGIKGKRNPLGKELEALSLLQYDIYKRKYYHWVSNNYNQSMLHKEAHAKHLVEILTDKLGVNFDFDSKMD